jgi:hypothetical protein
MFIYLLIFLYIGDVSFVAKDKQEKRCRAISKSRSQGIIYSSLNDYSLVPHYIFDVSKF